MSPFTLRFEHCVLYRELRNELRPILNVEFRVGEAVFNWLMLLDSGADNIVLPAAAMELAGLEPGQCEVERASMFYGPAESFLSPESSLHFPDLSDDLSFTAPLRFSPRLDPFGYGLLGREPTLDHLRLAFTHEIGPSFFIGSNGDR